MKYSAILLFSGFILLSSCKKNDSKEKESDWLPNVTRSDHGPSKTKEYTGTITSIGVYDNVRTIGRGL